MGFDGIEESIIRFRLVMELLEGERREKKEQFTDAIGEETRSYGVLLAFK